jgi:mannose-1-phosphate guanylyltransferase
MPEPLYAVILAGGRGERFWPLTTARRPKHLLALVGDTPLLASAVRHLEGLVPPEKTYVITSADHVRETAGVVPGLPRANIVGEPCSRDTAAAVALGTALVRSRDPEAVYAVLTADHVIGDAALFRRTLEESAELARRRKVLVTIGITPTFPSTGFGYIEADEPLQTAGTIRFLVARRFIEKPDAASAAVYVASRRYFWNAGMFVWSVPVITNAFARCRPQLAGMIERLVPRAGAPDWPGLLDREYAALDRISIDYAVMEKSPNIAMAVGTFAWDDVGSWPALANHFPADDAGNTLIGDAETLDADGNIVVSPGRLTALLGVRDLVVVQAEGVTLVCARERAQDLKRLVQKLRDKGGYHELL